MPAGKNLQRTGHVQSRCSSLFNGLRVLVRARLPRTWWPWMQAAHASHASDALLRGEEVSSDGTANPRLFRFLDFKWQPSWSSQVACPPVVERTSLNLNAKALVWIGKYRAVNSVRTVTAPDTFCTACTYECEESLPTPVKEARSKKQEADRYVCEPSLLFCALITARGAIHILSAHFEGRKRKRNRNKYCPAEIKSLLILQLLPFPPAPFFVPTKQQYHR